jgi:chromosome segregation ATPase
MADAKDSE